MTNYINTSNPYTLPDTLYRRVIATIRDYDRRKAEYDDLCGGSPSSMHSNIHRRKGVRSNPTENTAIRREELFRELHAIEQALFTVPEKYRDGIMGNIMFPRSGYPKNAHVDTYRIWKRKFICAAAENLKLI